MSVQHSHSDRVRTPIPFLAVILLLEPHKPYKGLELRLDSAFVSPSAAMSAVGM